MLFNDPLRKIKKIANKVDSYDSQMSKMTNEELRNKTDEFKKRLEKETLDDILPEAFAVCREAAWRVLGKKPYFVQIMGGVSLHQGQITEMSTGEGKSVPLDTPIPTPNGWIKAGDVKVGDIFFDRLGKPTTVLGVYPQGTIDTYEITLRDGRTIKCAAEHLWSVYDNYHHSSPLTTLTTEEMFKKGAKRSRGYNYHLPVSSPVHYPEANLKIDPYIMGTFLGDGCRNASSKSFELSTSDEETVKHIKNLLNAHSYKKHKGDSFSWYFYKDEGVKLKIADIDPTYTELLSQLYCYEKYIPEEYKLASIEQRWTLIQGLMDSDGNIYRDKEEKRYNMQFSTTSERLRDDIMEVLYSLGCSCSYRLSRKANTGNAKRDQYTIKIHVPHNLKPNFFRLSRKKNIALEAASKPERKKDYSRIAIIDIKKLEEKTEQVCFTVDNDEHLFLVGQYVVTHNTITETMPAYLNALTGKGVHIITVNDYLAERDMQEMGKIFKFLGLTVSWIYPKMDPREKQKAYQCDIVYGTNKEYGFDYLRDNMAGNLRDTFQRELNYAIIDEVDSILIDEARTPLIISNQGQESTDIYKRADACVRTLKRGEDAKEVTKIESIMENMEKRELTPEEIERKGDFTVNEKDKTVILTDRGIEKVEKFFGISNFGALEHTTLSHHVSQALRAHNIMHIDKDYIVKDGQVMIVDEGTGRVLDGRRYSDGLHQAIEAKEGVEIQKENNTMATISLQNYFRLYNKIAGMTGTAATEKTEFKDIYKMDVVSIPTNKPVIRDDMLDRIYQSETAKFNAIVTDIIERAKKGQPVLVGTPNIEQSEKLSKVLKKNGIKHNLLNAKNHEKEAGIIAQAGKFGTITIATNMAGRGTDIILGGNPEHLAKEKMYKEGYEEEMVEIATNMLPPTTEEEAAAKNRYQELLEEEKVKCTSEAEQVRAVGGLHVIGTARHESRRIENQLRGRAGRQGDPGSSQFFISLDDDVIRLFAGDKIKLMIQKLGIPEEYPLDTAQMAKSVETAQKRFETKHFETRKNTLEYDDVNNGQRKTIYSLRREILEGKDMNETIDRMFDFTINELVSRYIPEKNCTVEQLAELNEAVKAFVRSDESILNSKMNKKEATQKIKEVFEARYNEKKAEIASENGNFADLQRFILLKVIDRKWISYITALQNLRDSVTLVAYGNEKPIDAYKREAFHMFNDLINSIKEDTVRALLNVVIKKPEPVRITMKPISINLDANGKPVIDKAGSGILLKTKPITPNINPNLKNK